MTKEKREEGRKLFGNVNTINLVPETIKERLEIVHQSIGNLIENYNPDKMIMDIDTLVFIVHWHPETEGISVGMKYEGWWTEDGKPGKDT